MSEQNEATQYLERHPEMTALEILSPDMNGMLRAKRIPRSEVETFFHKGLTGPGTTPIMNSLGDCSIALTEGTLDGDPDKGLHPVNGTLSSVPWLQSDTHQVLGDWTELDGSPNPWNPRTVLKTAFKPFAEMGLKAVVATEFEFYLLASGDEARPQPRLGRVLGTGRGQQGTQYCNQEDMAEYDEFLDAIREACVVQNVPATTAHLEFAPGQFEINLHHVDDVLLACDQAMLLKRLIKGVAWQRDMGVTFMAKPFAEHPGSGLHIHISLYDEQDNNIFADPDSSQVPPIGERMRHAVGGLAQAMPDSQAIFAPNANSYRRLQPGCYAPLSPNWGYNHRGLSLRIPVSDPKNLRIEHRVAGADANPYLVMAAILAGIHHGLENQCEPGPYIDAGTLLEEEEITLPTNWPAALDLFQASSILPRYLGEEYCRIFGTVRRDECQLFNAEISDIDYRWYQRSV